MTDQQWPREIWMAEREDHDQGVVTAFLSEFATARDRDTHRYVDGDIHDNADRYWRFRVEGLSQALDLKEKLRVKDIHEIRRLEGEIAELREALE